MTTLRDGVVPHISDITLPRRCLSPTTLPRSTSLLFLYTCIIQRHCTTDAYLAPISIYHTARPVALAVTDVAPVTSSLPDTVAVNLHVVVTYLFNLRHLVFGVLSFMDRRYACRLPFSPLLGTVCRRRLYASNMPL